MKEERHPK